MKAPNPFIPDIDVDEEMFGSGEPAMSHGTGHDAWLRELLANVNQSKLRAEVERFSFPHNRLHDPEQMHNVEDKIFEELGQNGWEVARSPFQLHDVKGGLDYGAGGAHLYSSLSGTNIIATRKGSGIGQQAVVLIAHYDTCRDTPGADDNMASVAALLEVARLTRDSQFDSTVILAFTDFEELGFLGAAPLLTVLQERYLLKAVIVLDCMAFTDIKPHTMKLESKVGRLYRPQWERMQKYEWAARFELILYQKRSAQLASVFASCLAVVAEPDSYVMLRDLTDLPLAGPIFRLFAPKLVRQFRRSDHVPFWRAGIPAIMVTDGGNFSNPNYHKATDLASTLNYTRLSENIAALCGSVAKLANSTGK